jgi:hypothetical protein
MMNQMVSVAGPMSRQKEMAPMQGMHMQSMQMNDDVSKDANRVPGFPQDAYMEGPMMAVDDLVKKPENYNLPPGWSGFMQGMMTFVRVLPPDQYDQVMERIRRGQS